MDSKKCTGKCGEIKTLENFSIGQYWCKNCVAEYNKQYAIKNKEEISKNKKVYQKEHKEEIAQKAKRFYQENKEEKLKYAKNYREDHKEEAVAYQKIYREENKEERLEYIKIYRENNKEKISEDKKQFYIENREGVLQSSKEYREENKEKVAETSKKSKKKRRDNDPVYRLRRNISSSIWKILNINASSKQGHSILEFLPFTIKEIFDHIEGQFEWWMTWENQGLYKEKEWNDADSTTWKWQLDHIIPHSTFHYKNMECEEFQKCWALSNLRPLNAKQNLLDGVNRTRHQESKINGY